MIDNLIPNFTQIMIDGTGDEKLDGSVGRVVGIAQDFRPLYVMYIIDCPGIIEYDCFLMHSAYVKVIR